MEDPTAARDRRAITPAIVASALFAAACAVFAIAFVGARGGLQMPVAATKPPVAAATTLPTVAPPTILPTEPPATAAQTAGPPTTPPVSAPPPPPTAAPSPAATPDRGPSFDPNDPLLALPRCAANPACFEYTVARGDTFSTIADRYLVPLATMLALNPELGDPSTIVVGQILYLGRDPFVRLEPCPGTPGCSVYVVRAGDTMSTIASRFGLTVDAILDANPSIENANSIFTGQEIRLPHPA